MILAQAVSSEISSLERSKTKLMIIIYRNDHSNDSSSLTFTLHIAKTPLASLGTVVLAVDLKQTIVLAIVLLPGNLVGIQRALVLHQADP